jgi:hypothetical protein
MPTMFAAYDRHGRRGPVLFPLDSNSIDSATTAGFAYDLGVRMKSDRHMREIVAVSDDTALVHLGTLIRFPARCEFDIGALYAIGSTEAEKDIVVRLAARAAIDPDFGAGMWKHLRSFRRARDGKVLPEQDHLSIAIVTDLESPGRYTATTVDSEVSQ